MTAIDIKSFESQENSIEIEKHFLAAAYNHLCFAFGDNEWIDQFISLPQREDLFCDVFNRYMFDCLKEEYLTFNQAPTNDITISTRLKNISGCDIRTAEEFVNQISSCPVEKDMSVWREKILPIWHLLASRRQVKESLRKANDIIDGGCGEEERKGALSLVLTAADLIEHASSYETQEHPFASVKNALLGPKIENRVIRTRFSGLNSALCGGLNHYENGSHGRFIVACGRPGSGKSTWAMNLALDVTLNGCGVLFYSLEMSGEQICKRMLSCMDYLKCIDSSGEPVTYGQIVRQAINDQQRQRISSMPIEKIEDNMVFADGYNVTPSQVVARIRSEKRKNKKLVLVVIDYLTLMDIDSDSGNKDTRALMIGNATRKLKLVALKTGVDILAVCQLNRVVETRTDKRPVMSDLRESGRIEEDADLIIGNYWPYYYNKNEDMMNYEYAVLKNRDGSTGVSNILFAPEYYSMHESRFSF